MDDVVARCRSCGYEQAAEFLQCPVCLGVPAWWCATCRGWRPSRACPTCSGVLLAPTEFHLGSFPPGTRVPVRFTVRNPGRKSLEFSIHPVNAALTLLTRRLSLKPSEEGAVVGAVVISDHPPGRRAYRIRFATPIPTKTDLVVDVVPAVVRLEFSPTRLLLHNAQPRVLIRRDLILKNVGNVPVTASLAPSVTWLSVLPASVELTAGKSATIKVCIRSRKAAHGLLVGRVRAESSKGLLGEATIQVQLPEPKLDAAPIDFGDVRADRPAYQTVTIRNVGKVRVACTLACDQPWLAVAPGRVNLRVGGAKVVRARAIIPAELGGPRTAALVVSFTGGELLRVPVSAICRVPKPILGPVRRQTLSAVASDAPVVRRFRITNVGDGQLVCSISANEPWIEVLTRELKVGPGKKRRVEFRLNTPSMSRGPNLTTVLIRSNGGTMEIPLSVTVVDPEPELEVIGNLDLGMVTGGQPVTGSLAVRNVGVGLLTLRVTADDPRVRVTPSEMILAPGPPTKLGIAVAVEGLEGGLRAYWIRFSSNGGVGSAYVRFHLPIEQIDAPGLIDLGDRPAGKIAGGAVRIRNVGMDGVNLRVRCEHPWVHPGADQIDVKPGEIVVLPFRVDLSQGVPGPVTSTIWLEGRALRHEIALRGMARTIDLVVIPQVLDLGEMTPGTQRAFLFQIVNKGELPADVRDSHSRGELEVWIRGQTVPPGSTATLTGHVKVNARTAGKQLRSMVRLVEGATLQFTANVVRPRTARIIAVLVATSGLVAGVALGATTAWMVGSLIALGGLLVGGTVLAVNRMHRD